MSEKSPVVYINHKPRLFTGSPYFGEMFLKQARKQGKKVYFWKRKSLPELVLVIDWTLELERLKYYREKEVKIVQRIDGAGIKYSRAPEKDNLIYQTYNYVDAVIFQSQFCQEVWKRAFALDKPSYIILNGADERVFSREGKKESFPFKKVIVTASRWRPWKGLEQMIEVFLALRRDDVGFVILGELKKAGVKIPDHPGIITTGKVSHKKMAEIFRGADLFLYLAWHDWCPKVVSQALVCGLPVICLGKGGTRELVGDCGIILRGEKDQDLDWWGENRVNIKEAVEAINTLLEQGKKIPPRPDLYLSTMVRKYFEVFEKVLEI